LTCIFDDLNLKVIGIVPNARSCFRCPGRQAAEIGSAVVETLWNET
jgi:hypothetical protein